MVLVERITWREVFALIICAFAVFSCAQNPGAATAASGATAAPSQLGITSTLGSSGSSSSGTSPLTVSYFTPSSGTSVTTLPTTVQVTYSESNLTSSASTASYYTVSCTCGWSASATAVSVSGYTATVTLPSMVCPSAVTNNTCTLTPSTMIQDTSNNRLTSTFDSYTVTNSSATTLEITGFSPASGTTPVPSSVVVSFSSVELNASTVQNTSNWSFYCTSGGYLTIQSVSYNNDGAATVTLPANISSLPASTTCTLTALSGITDIYGDPLVSQSASYSVGSSSANLTQVGAAGGNGGSPIADIYGPSGTSGATGQARLLGMNVTVGGSYVTEIQPEWSDQYGDTMYYGQIGPGTDSSYGTYTTACQAYYGYRAVGIYGTLTNGGCGSGGNSSCILTIGLICQIEPESAYSVYGTATVDTYTEGNFFQTAGSSYNLQCPAGTFITMLYGRAGAGVDQIGIACQ